MNSQTLGDALTRAWKRLEQSGADSPRLTAELFLADVLNVTRSYLVSHDRDHFSDETGIVFWEMVTRRERGEPTAYILGEREFWGLPFAVDASVLIPRPETELIIEWGLELVRGKSSPKFLDLGVGSGCILGSLLHEIQDAVGIGIDISFDAACVALKNLRSLGLASRSMIVVGDLGDSLNLSTGFQLITNNPPYILPKEAPELSREVREHEPALALFCDSEDAMRDVRRLGRLANSLLDIGGAVLVEVAAGKAQDVSAALCEAELEVFDIRDDLAGIPRVVGARRVV